MRNPKGLLLPQPPLTPRTRQTRIWMASEPREDIKEGCTKGMARRRRARTTVKRRRARRQPSRGAAGWLINKWTIGGLTLVLVGLAGLWIASQSSPATTTPTTVANQQNIPFPEVPRIPLAEAKAKFDAGTALIVDTRSAEDYAQSHIPNALSLPLADMNTQNPDLPRDAEIITYCT